MPTKIFTATDWWSTSKLCRKTETIISLKQTEGWELINVSFGMDIWWKLTSFVVMRKEES